MTCRCCLYFEVFYGKVLFIDVELGFVEFRSFCVRRGGSYGVFVYICDLGIYVLVAKLFFN